MRPVALALGVLLCLGACAPMGAGAGSLAPSLTPPGPVRNILMIHVVPRSTPALVAVEQTFTSTLKSISPEPLAFHAEYVDLGMFERKETFERELVAYLAAKYGSMKLDLVVITASDALRLAMRHRTRLFPRVPIVFMGVIERLVTDIRLGGDVSGIWLPIDWAGTLAAARALQPDIERAIVVTGASPVDRLWAADARAQLARVDSPIPITYLAELPIEKVLHHLAALPRTTVVLLGPFLADATGRRFSGPETTALFSAASPVPVYGVTEAQLGHGTVGGRLISFALQGRRGAEMAARMLRGERPPPIVGDTLAYRFDARQLRRFGLDRRRLPPGSAIEFDQPSLWRAYGGYVAGALGVLAVQTWMIVGLLAHRAKRRRAERELAARLRFETLLSDLLAGQLTSPTAGVDAEISRALTLIAADLDVDRIVVSERDASTQSSRVTHAWTRHEVVEVGLSVSWSAFPWISGRLGEGHVVVVSPSRPLPSEAVTDRQSMLTHGSRSLLAVPLRVERTVVGVLTCATVRREREWPDALIDRLQLLADAFASILARRRAEAVARESEARFEQQRHELMHALRVNTLGELGASLAHEINQPLSAMLMNARAVSAILGPHAGADVREALGDIAADAKRAGEIIRRLRALSRKEHVPERGLDVNVLVDEVAGLLHQDFVRRGIVVQRVAEPTLPTVTGDRIQLQQIVLNVLVNAAEALEGTERGRRSIVIATTTPAPGLVQIVVRDSGLGDKNLDTERIFERFVTSKAGGLGMGLAISRSIANTHGGRIYAKANVDRGLTVYVELPADVSQAG
jgi:signal transduction histidine kinase